MRRHGRIRALPIVGNAFLRSVREDAVLFFDETIKTKTDEYNTIVSEATHNSAFRTPHSALICQVKPFRFVDPARIGDDLRRFRAAARAGFMRGFGFAPADGADVFIRLKQMRSPDPNGSLVFFVKHCRHFLDPFDVVDRGAGQSVGHAFLRAADSADASCLP